MGVVYAKELWTGRRGRDGIDRKRQFTRTFEVRTTQASDDPTVAGGTSELPRNGEAHPSDPNARVVDIQPDQHDEDPTLWTVTVQYDTEVFAKAARGGSSPAARQAAGETQRVDPDTGETSQADNPNERAENPLDRPPSMKVSFSSAKEAAKWATYGVRIVAADGTVLYDYTDPGDPLPAKMKAGDGDGSVLITNTAGKPFLPAIEVEKGRCRITITQNFASISIPYQAYLYNSVNAVPWCGLDARMGKVSQIEIDSHYENGQTFWQRVLSIDVDPNTWDLSPTDAGFDYWDPGSEGAEIPGHYVPFHAEGSGEKSDTPGLLDGNGYKLADGESPVTLYFRYYREIDFNTAL